jgi:Amt family ammonium transporter
MTNKLRTVLFCSVALMVPLSAPVAAVAQESAAPAAAAPAPAPNPAPAPTPAPTPAISGADTAFMMISAALVMLMTPGLGLFYGGMVRRKNVLATFQQSFIMLGVMTVQWTLIGYSLAFGPDKLNGFVGGLEWVGLKGVGLAPNPDYAATIPHQLFMVYQLMFAIITPALISGAFAERMKFSAYVAFCLLWSTFVYDPVAHWVWGTGGWIKVHLGALDFAGGLVVHLISGIAALCCVLTMGKRVGHGEEEMHPHNLMMTALGTALLWFGWFGFNAGSALTAGTSAVAAFVNTNTAAGVAALAWITIEWMHKGKATILGACTGAVAGLVAITPAAGFVTIMGAVVIGEIVCVVCYTAVLLKSKFGYDDSLDVFGVHGVGGAFGALAVGLLARAGISGDVSGLVDGNPIQLGYQALSLVAAGTYSFVLTFGILKLVDLTIGLRVTAEEEEIGLDLTQHGERGYIMGVGELIVDESHEIPVRPLPTPIPQPMSEPVLADNRY